MKDETVMRRYVVSGLRKLGCHVIPIENGVSFPGTPDLNFCCDGVEFWIECKCLQLLPTRPITPIRVPHFTAEQFLWLRGRKMAGGKCGLLLKIMDPAGYFLLTDLELIHSLQKQEALLLSLRQQAIYYGPRLPFEQLLKDLKNA